MKFVEKLFFKIFLYDWSLLTHLNLYSPNVTFLYPLKTSENGRFSDVFRGYGNVTLGEYGLTQFSRSIPLESVRKPDVSSGYRNGTLG